MLVAHVVRVQGTVGEGTLTCEALSTAPALLEFGEVVRAGSKEVVRLARLTPLTRLSRELLRAARWPSFAG